MSPRSQPEDAAAACHQRKSAALPAPASTEAAPGGDEAALLARLRATPVARVHGRWLDLTGFEHPGGPVALGLARGRDATALFEAHHALSPRGTLAATVQRLEVRDARACALLDALHAGALADARVFEYDWRAAASSLSAPSASESASSTLDLSSLSVDGFERDVKALFHDYFSAEARRRGVLIRVATKAPPARVRQLLLLLAAHVLLGVLPLARGYWFALLTCPVFAWLFMVNSWHDAAHFALSADWRANVAATYVSPWFSSPLMWYHQHVVGHHVFTNVPLRDPDLYHAPRFWRLTPSLRWAPLHALQSLLTLPLWLVSVPTLLLVKPLQALHAGRYNRSVRLQPLSPLRVAAHLAGRAFVFASLFVWPFVAFSSRWKALCFALVPVTVFSLLFMAFSQINHLVDECSHAAPVSGATNFYRHQAASSHTVAPGSALVFFLSGGLNLQVEHHLFPTVNHHHLRALQPQVEALCRKHGVAYPRSETLGDAFAALWRHLRALGAEPPRAIEAEAAAEQNVSLLASRP